MVHAKTMLRPKYWRAANALKDAWGDGKVGEIFDAAAPKTKQYLWLKKNLSRVRQEMKEQPLRDWGKAKPEQQIAQIELSMERIRWLPRENGQRRIEVNIPEFKVRMTSRGRLLHHSKVVVGKPGRSATPLFAGRLSRVDLNPSWYVPHSIAKYKLLPRIRKNPEFVSEQNMVFTERDGTEHSEVTDELLKMVARNRARIEQLPGDENALGRYKFVLPNHRAIFMHDTNQRELFDRDVRAFSAGCVRVEKADHLARMVLLGTKWNKSRIGARIETGETKAINTQRPTLVVLHYQTARATSPRKVRFFDDLYGMDAQAYAYVNRWSRAFAPVQRLAGL
jgi:murein L,D-transpeptidase YcbB/YkuD